MAPRRRRRCSEKKERTVHVSVFKYTPVPLPERDWAELHPDLISCILHRLDMAELLIGGVAGVCRSWRRAAREEPDLWRRIDLRGGLYFVPPFPTEVSFSAMVRAALRHSAGQCEAFLSDLVYDDTLLLLAQRAPLLKSLHLITGYLSNEGFAKAIRMLPLLEELEISVCLHVDALEVVELVAGAFLLMKHFRLVTPRDYIKGNRVAFVVARMNKLCSLHLVGLTLDNKGLTAILDNCHDLEYLNMRDCSLIAMCDSLRVKLARIDMDDQEYLSDYYSDYYSGYSYLHNCRYHQPYGPAWRYGRLVSYPEYEDDSHDDYWYYLGDGDDDVDADIEEHEKILDIKSMRRYLS